MLGVNSWNHEPGELKEVMIKEEINWRTFDDGGAINRQWNLPATPTFCIIDFQGTIRRKWVGKPGKKSVDDALDKLIQELEQSNAPKR